MDFVHPTIIIVTGRPAAGKSTLAKWLSQELRFALVSKDSIRKELFDRLGWKDRAWAQELGKASVDMMFYFAGAALEVGHSIIMDNTFDPVVSAPRFQALKDQYNAQSIQIICDAGNEILFERFKNRSTSSGRHPGHGDEAVLDNFHEFLISNYSPLLDIGGSVIEVDMNDFSKVDYGVVLKQVRSLLAEANHPGS